MIIPCPKCKFEQPKIDYCAACGIHIDSFVQEKPPLVERLTKNSSTYLFLLLALFIGSVAFVKNHWFSNDLSSTEFQPSYELEVISMSEEPTDIKRSMSSTEELSLNAADDRQALATVADENPYVLIQVLEMPASILAFLNGKTLGAEDLNEVAAISINKEKLLRLNQASGIVSLYQNKYYVNNFQKPLRIQQTVYDDSIDDETGFILSFDVDAARYDKLELSVSVSKNFYASQAKAEALWQKTSKQLVFEPGTSFVMQGILPQRPLHPKEQSLFKEGFLKIMRNESYANNEITLVVILTYYTDNSQ